MVTNAQVGLLRQKRMENKTQETAAASADMSVRSARKWQAGPIPSESKRARDWRTRPDAFAEVWLSMIVPLLMADTKGVLEAKTLIELLQEKRPGKFEAGQVRTLQRRMRALPSSPVPGYTKVHSTVRKWSTIRVGKKTYSVPSRLIGYDIDARLYPDTVEVYYRDDLVLTMPRLHGEYDHHIDYRHVVWSLVKKPGAFARYRYREDLFPSLVFRRTYDSLVARRGDRADVEYVRILHLAASTMESLVEKALDGLLWAGASLDYAMVKALCAPEPPRFPVVAIGEPDLGIYDRLLLAPCAA